jgi:hypothetical protein
MKTKILVCLTALLLLSGMTTFAGSLCDCTNRRPSREALLQDKIDYLLTVPIGTGVTYGGSAGVVWDRRTDPYGDWWVTIRTSRGMFTKPVREVAGLTAIRLHYH